MALYLDVVENFLVTPRTGVGVAFNKGILIDYTQLGNKCHAFFSHLFVRSRADQSLSNSLVLASDWLNKISVCDLV